jgi:hypothetical protein
MADVPAERMCRALGADTPVPVHAAPHGPFGLEWLARELGVRGTQMGSAGHGDRDVQRPVGFRRDTWRVLDALAQQASTPERRVTAAEVAALLVEREVARLAAGRSSHP